MRLHEHDLQPFCVLKAYTKVLQCIYTVNDILIAHNKIIIMILLNC